jgi:hypothetical protein
MIRITFLLLLGFGVTACAPPMAAAPQPIGPAAGGFSQIVHADPVALIIADQGGRPASPRFAGVIGLLAAGLTVPTSAIATVTIGECIPGANPCW